MSRRDEAHAWASCPRTMRDRRLALLIPLVAVVVTGCATAGAATPRFTPTPGVAIQQGFDRAGNPSLLDNAENVGPHPKMTWLMCLPADARCRPVTHGLRQLVATAQALNPGRTTPGTFFKAIARRGGHTYVARSATWIGAVIAVGAPRVSGQARVGALVRPIAGRWSGGWSRGPTRQQAGGSISAGLGPDRDQLSIEACRTVSGRRCLNLSPQTSRFCLYSPHPVQVPARFAGWYLFAFDQRVPQPQLCAEPQFASPEVEPTVRRGPTASRSTPLGPVIR